MSKNDGWIKIHRSMLDWEWYGDANTFRLFMHLLIMANHEPKKWRGHVIDRGQRITSLSHLADETGLSVQQVRTSIRNLKSTGEITSQSTSKNTVITICKYDTYQSQECGNNKQGNTPDNKRTTNEQQTDNKRITTNKNDKNDKNDKKKELIDLDEPNTTQSDDLVLTGSDEKNHGVCPYKQIVDLYNEILGATDLPVCKIATPSRKAALRRTWAFFNYDAKAFRGYFKQVKESDFLCSRGKNNFQATFDWLLKQQNIIKVLEGNYNNG